MNVKKKLILLSTVFALFSSSFAFAAKEESTASQTVAIEPIAADALLKKIATQKGKVVVINIFASWCPPCREEVPGIIANRKRFSEKDVFIVGVSVDKTQAALTSFVTSSHFNYPIFSAQGTFVETFGVNAIPQMLIYDKKGKLVHNHKGLLDEASLAELIEREMEKK